MKKYWKNVWKISHKKIFTNERFVENFGNLF